MRKAFAEHAIVNGGYSKRRACQLANISRTTLDYQAKEKPDDKLIAELLLKLAEEQPKWGFKPMFDRIRKSNHPWNHKKVYRVYCDVGLNERFKNRKLQQSEIRVPDMAALERVRNLISTSTTAENPLQPA